MAKPYCRPVRFNPADPQQYRLYRMENEAIGARTYMSMEERSILRYIRGLVRTYSCPPVVVKFEDIGKWAAEWRDPNIIVLGTKVHSRDVLTVAHEFAHHLHGWLTDNTEKHFNHGKEFLTCYMSVLDTSRIVPVVGMRAICAAYKLQYVEVGHTKHWEDVTKIKEAIWPS